MAVPEAYAAAVEYMLQSDQARVLQHAGQPISGSRLWCLGVCRDRLDAVLPCTPRRLRRPRWWDDPRPVVKS